MHNKNLILACLATAICAVSGQGLSNDDIPPECRSICQPVVDTERRCDNQFDDDGDDNVNQPGVPSNQQYRDCVCQDQNASQALAQCNECTARYPNFFIDNDNDNDDGPGPDVDDNEIAQWARICGLPVQNNGTNGTTGTLTAAPSSLPTSLTTSMRTVTQTFDCDSPPDNDTDDILDDVNDTPDNNENDPQCTRTTVVPVVGIATGTAGPITSGATSTPTGVSVSYTTSTGTDSAGNAATFTSAVASLTGAAALPTAAAGYFGAGAAALLAAFAM
ncbi:hypothetical protein Slin15195_G044770 [Septoria linicola]|uniref:Uncharacterized protein n=1 Tax=Septoria linicola TaxID=215465 RepID=A0A9Q9AQB8_9PEZI|nr:hypothetical protein Slin14017_G048290 [Septoria linicola]USW51158.1 hypothetical protein Slin15195_G044770 [Septoria linicola]